MPYQSFRESFGIAELGPNIVGDKASGWKCAVENEILTSITGNTDFASQIFSEINSGARRKSVNPLPHTFMVDCIAVNLKLGQGQILHKPAQNQNP